jgi:phosphatidylserine decarboxylase
MNDLLDALKLVTFPIHKEGYKFIFIFAIATAILALISNVLGLIGLVATLWCIFFFRDPERFVPLEDNAIISPADGVVTRVEYGAEAPEELGYGKTKFNKISIFLNVFNVHVNRVPLSGSVTKVIYRPGKLKFQGILKTFRFMHLLIQRLEKNVMYGPIKRCPITRSFILLHP